jgi:acyl carrier protein
MLDIIFIKKRNGGCSMVFKKVRAIIVDQLDVDEDKVKVEASITDDLGADSLDAVDLVMSLEEEFDIEIPDEQVENFKTVGDIVKFIEENV